MNTTINQAETIDGLVKIKSNAPVRAEVHAHLEAKGFVQFGSDGKAVLTPEGEREVYWPTRHLHRTGMKGKLMATAAVLSNQDTVRAAIEQKCSDDGVDQSRGAVLTALDFIRGIRSQLGIGTELGRIRRLRAVAADISRPRDITDRFLGTAAPQPGPSLG